MVIGHSNSMCLTEKLLYKRVSYFVNISCSMNLEVIGNSKFAIPCCSRYLKRVIYDLLNTTGVLDDTEECESGKTFHSGTNWSTH